MRKLLIYALICWFFSSCEKPDQAVVLPPPGPVTPMTAVLGPNYDMQTYVSLSKNTTSTVPCKGYDLAFEASATGAHIYLNGAKLMFATMTSSYDIIAADTVGSNWKVDQEHLDPDSTALGDWWVSSLIQANKSRVFIIDRGTGGAPSDRYRKFQINYYGSDKYSVTFANLNNSGLTSMDIPKDSTYSLMYLDFTGGGHLVQQAPPKNDWDFVFTRYTHVYFDEPVGSIFRNYTVTGGILNIWNNTSGIMLRKDSLPNFVPFTDYKYTNCPNYTFENRGDVIGFVWKYYNFNDSRYYVYPDLYYVIKDHDGVYYKLRMIDFYDQQGNKGTISMEIQRI